MKTQLFLRLLIIGLLGVVFTFASADDLLPIYKDGKVIGYNSVEPGTATTEAAPATDNKSGDSAAPSGEVKIVTTIGDSTVSVSQATTNVITSGGFNISKLNIGYVESWVFGTKGKPRIAGHGSYKIGSYSKKTGEVVIANETTALYEEVFSARYDNDVPFVGEDHFLAGYGKLKFLKEGLEDLTGTKGKIQIDPLNQFVSEFVDPELGIAGGKTKKNGWSGKISLLLIQKQF